MTAVLEYLLTFCGVGYRAEKGMKNPVGEAIAWRDAGEYVTVYMCV